jgi:uncharacterized membrane protein YhaH (DUF805 family)
MIAETKHCLRNLANFTGRDSRRTFWMYVLALVIVQFVIGMVMFIPLLWRMIGQLIEAAQAAEAAGGVNDPEQINGAMAGLMGPMMGEMLVWTGIMALVMSALFVAAFVRRLHDAGYSGWIALVPLATQAFATIYSYSQIERMMALMETAMASQDPQAMSQMQAQIGPWGYVGYIGYLVVIVFGIMDSQAGPNRFGDDPA